MASRQSQLHSYQFALQRLVSALVTRETDPAQAPFRRILGAAFAGVMLSVLALAATGIYGLVVAGGNTSWKTEHAVIVERESGARYVYLDGKLHPVLNYASALLIARSGEAKTILVSRNSLRGHPKGTPLGIPGAPDSLTAAEQLLGAPWTLCSTPDRRPSGAVVPHSVLLVGHRPGGGRPLVEGEGILVAVAGSDDEYLLTRSHRYRIPAADRKVVHDALGAWPNPVLVAPAFVNGLPAGVDLAAPKISDRGGRSPVSGLAVGDVARVTVPGVEPQNYVVLVDGLAKITQLQANLFVSARGVLHERSQSWYVAQRQSKQRPAGVVDSAAALPDLPPKLVRLSDAGYAVCAAFAGAAAAPEILVDTPAPEAGDAVVTAARSGAGTVLADRIVVPPGRGAVVEAMPGPGAAAGTVCVITDLGTAYPLPRRDVLDLLGYRGVTPLRVPSSLVALLPTGRALDPDAARTPAVGQ